MGQMSSNTKKTKLHHQSISYEDVKKALNGNTEYENMVINDVLIIVNAGYKYLPRGLT
jgi:hypothetical protein